MIIVNITKLNDSIEFYSPIIILSITGILFCCFYGLTYKKRVLINPSSNNSSPSNSAIHNNNRLEKIEENTNENDDHELPSYSELFNK
tara:strand:+ start:1120 stop:1383 length:264 start_codon:yes stop_codon:yes gene_type:complete